jgi:hypothetical protein
MSKHTSGEWYVRSGMTQMCGPGSTLARLRPAGNEGMFWWLFSDAALGNAEADARLIAAAPELLEALQAMVKTWEEGFNYSDAQNEIGNARAAIAKATGEQA